ncbi:MAG: MarR family transcriptional regulator, partial [Bacillota bacterium]|nr:MarR family transcriptional regulator [Bacillota bacterium]
DFYRDLFLMQQTYSTLFSLTNKLQVKGDKFIGEITTRQYMVLIAISHLPDEKASLNNISKMLGTTKQNVKQLIKILEAKGFVVTLPSRKDKRTVNIKITEAAKPVLINCTEKGTEFLSSVFSEFSTQEMETLWGLLKKMYGFDGEEQNGFEEEPPMEIDSNMAKAQERILSAFEKTRNEKSNS